MRLWSRNLRGYQISLNQLLKWDQPSGTGWAVWLAPVRQIFMRLLCRCPFLSFSRICLVRGQQEETWALPGGFCEVGLPPKENIVKKFRKKLDFQVSVVRLLAAFDSNTSTAMSKQYVKLVFECQLKEGNFQPNSRNCWDEFLWFYRICLFLPEKGITKEQMGFSGIFIRISKNNI